MSQISPHVKVAFTTNSLTCVDADFFRARHIVIYEVTAEGGEFSDVVEFRPPPEEGRDGAARPDGCPGPDAGLPAGASALAGDRLSCLIETGLLFTTGLGDRTAMRLARAGTFPVVVEHRRVIDDVVARLQVLMRRDPPLWLCRLLRYGPRPIGCPRPAPVHDI